MKNNKRIYTKIGILILAVFMILSTFPFSALAEAGAAAADDDLQTLAAPEIAQDEQEVKEEKDSVPTEESENTRDIDSPEDSKDEEYIDSEDDIKDGKDIDSANNVKNEKGVDSEADSKDKEGPLSSKDSNETDESAPIEDVVKQEETSSVSTDADSTETGTNNMPSQEFEEEINGLKVSASAPEGAFPPNTRIKIEPVDSENIQSAVEETLEGEVRVIRAVDITFCNSFGETIQPAVPIKVTLRDSEVADVESPVVVHVDEDENGKLVGEKVKDVTVDADSEELSFDAEHFSIYAVVEDDNPVPESRMILGFYNGSTKIASMYVKNGDTRDELDYIIYDPGAGTLQSGEIFTGWILDNENYTSADVANALTIDEVRDWAESLTIHEGEEHKLYASICKLYQVTYRDDNDAHTPLGMAGVPVKSSEYGTASVPYTVNMAYTPKDDIHNFEGWIVADNSIPNITSDVPDNKIYQNNTEISIKGDVDFTVNAPQGNWLIFDENGKGSTYNAPQFVRADSTTVQPCPDSEMTRNGYTFGGWYDSKEHADAHAANPSVTTGKFTFGRELTQKTTVYASWIPNATASYTVILWTQNLDRTAYEVAGSYVANGRVGQTIPYTFVNNGDEDYVTGVGSGNGHYTGFCLKAEDANQQITITPEGDAVLNLHYDRIQYNMRIYLYRKGAGNNSYQYAQNSNRGRNVWNIATWYTGTSINNMPTTTYGPIQSETVDGYTGYYILLSAYYGEDISSKWPRYDQISNPANNRYPVSFVMMNGTGLKGNGINDNGYGDGRDTIKGLITTMDEKILGKTNDSNGNYLIVRFNTYNSWRYHIWYETVDGEDYTGKTTHTYNGKTYYEADIIESRSSNTDVAQQNPPEYTGFEYNTRRNQNWSNGNSWQTDNPTTHHINYVYDRLNYQISYFDGTYMDGNGNMLQNRASQLLHKSDPIAQGAYIPDKDRDYVPDLPQGEEGYVFEGWYLDEACTTPYTWDKMPVGGIKVYAKWRQEEFRVILHPNAGTDPSLNWGSDNVSMSFRASYGEKVSTPTGTRPNSGYEFVGWYTDPSCSSQYLYNADTELNNQTVRTPYDQTDNTELDKWGNVIQGREGVNKDRDENRFWITRKLELYAKWRKVLEGSEGISVIYTADDGKGNVGTNPPTDPTLYPDQSEATAQAAATAPEGMEFKYWVIQKWDETENRYIDTDNTVVPGQKYTVDEALAHKVADPEHPGDYTYTVQLRAEYAAPESEIPTHIWWFKNYSENGAERHASYHQDERIQINEAITIQPAPTREGYRFLGWAREPMNITESTVGTPPTGKVLENLGADDLYLRYENGQYKLNDPTSTNNGKVVTKVAADERQQYHDMYAVWEPQVYTVKVIKKITGPYSDMQKEFTFTPSETLSEDPFILANNGEKTFSNIVYGTEITVTEEDQGYTPTVVVKKYSDASLAEDKLVSTDQVDNGAEITVDNFTVIEFTNELQIIITGLDGRDQAVVVIIVAVLAAVLAFAGKRVYRRRHFSFRDKN